MATKCDASLPPSKLHGIEHERQAQTLRGLFEPRSIAIVGASANPDKLGYALVHAIISGGYSGRVIPVNPTAKEICGLPVVNDVKNLPPDIDAAMVILPSEGALNVVSQLGAQGIKAVVIPAGGFAETGPDGATIEEGLRKIVASTGIRILGPNVPGFINAAVNLNATFGGGSVGRGNLAILSQAGSIAYLLLRNARQEGIDFGRFFCFGNQTDLCAADLLEYLGNDDGVQAICMYVESVRDGRKFVEIASHVSRVKPIVAIKGGITQAGHGAIFSHTASISSPELIYRAAFRRAGVIWSENLRTAAALTFSLASQGGARGARVAIITSLAGVGVIAADACDGYGLRVAEPSPDLAHKLRRIIPPNGSTRNPIDLTGDVTPAMLNATIRAVADSGEYDCLLPLVMGVPGSERFGNGAYGEACADALGHARTRGLVCAMQWVSDEVGGTEIAQVRERLSSLGVFVSLFPEEAVAILKGMVERGSALSRPERLVSRHAVDVASAVASVVERGDTVLTEHASKSLLTQARVPVVPSILVQSDGEAVLAAERHGYPVVLKLQSPDATHKSDVGGVALNLEDDDMVRTAFHRMSEAFRRLPGSPRLEGFSIQPMVRETGVELICGVAEDAQFGKYLMVGFGGIAVEVLKDVRISLLPVSEDDLRDMLTSLKGFPLLTGHRGRAPIDLDLLVEILARVAALGDVSDIVEVELNPLLASATQVTALDARIRLRERVENSARETRHSEVAFV